MKTRNIFTIAICVFIYMLSGTQSILAERLPELIYEEHEESALYQDYEVTGTVLDVETGEPLVGVNIFVQGTTEGTSTDLQGRFRIGLTNGEQILVFSYIGYESKEITVTDSADLLVELRYDSELLSEVVVTALGIRTARDAISSSVQEIRSDQLSEVRESNFLNSLSGRIAGMDIQRSAAGPTGTGRVVLRGESSLNINNNNALIVVDGVPMNNRPTATGQSAYGGDATIDFGTAAAQINPSDIESVSVLKGPSAAALYGSRGANGVILITTQNGRGQEGIGVSLSSSSVIETVSQLPDYQNEYGSGGADMPDYYSYGTSADGPSTANTGYSWGPKFEGQSFVQFGSPIDDNGNRVPIPWRANPNNVREYFDTGFTQDSNISVQGANDDGHFRFSVNRYDHKGTFPNSGLNRNNISLNSGYDITDRLDLSLSTSYSITGSDDLPTAGYHSSTPMYAFIWFERNASMDWLKNYWQEGQEGIQQTYFHTWADNPYFVANEHLNQFNRNHLYGNVSLNYTITDYLELTFRSGTDYSTETRELKRPYSTVAFRDGMYHVQDVTGTEYNNDVMLRYEATPLNDLQVSFSAGGNIMVQSYRDNTIRANGLVIPDLYNMGNSIGRPEIREYHEERSLNSLYGFSEISYRDTWFLSLSGRNDWSSTLPSDNNSYFYPSFGLSVLLSNILDLSIDGPVSYLKLKGSVARAGNDTAPYSLSRAYGYGSLPSSLTNPGRIPNAGLKPEIITSYEVGTEIRFLANRIGLDLIWYDNQSVNQIINVPLPVTTGFTSQVLNAGRIGNRGVEAIITASPLIGRSVQWDITVNYSRNRSKIHELIDGIDNYMIANVPPLGSVEARVGNRMGDIYGLKLSRTEDGEVIHVNGLPQRDPTIQRLGNYNPDWMGGISNKLSYKNMELSFLVDTKQGGSIVSMTHAVGSEAGILKHTLPGREEGIIGEGVMPDGNGDYVSNTTRVSAAQYYRARDFRSVTESHIFDASFVKLREVKIGYMLPDHILQNTPVRSATIQLVGRNLYTWTRVPNIDPETSSVQGATVVPGFEILQLPPTRSFGLNINLTL